ncbi:DEAD/DEAH box helicase family protein [Nocardioides sp. CN2-186]|uniref:DEAD/DEAH box helicase family protein n=1 Tax=Nocardioides tweenelious TaxID=3156607 RepID=UPI0032B3A082
MTRDEATTRRDLIDPLLHDAGWSDGLLDREYRYKAGRAFLIGDDVHRDVPQFVDYVLRERPGGSALAVLEAKDEGHAVGAGLHQAVAYATDLGVPIAMSSNGHGFLIQDLRTGFITESSTPPSPAQVVDCQSSAFGQPEPNPLRSPALVDRPLRYYQERAIKIAVEAAMTGRRRVLLNLATGTGKTVVAGNIVWKLWRTNTSRKTLFLVDRLALLSQAYNSFAAFGDARGVVGEDDELPMLRDIHFATYQTLYSTRGGAKLFESYPRDYFDCVVVDECHRSGYGDWRAILEHFESSVQIGLTATPKRADNLDTYAYFGAENLDSNGQGQADYEYSLSRGIEDGFLATYQVLQVSTNIDQSGLHITRELELGAELFVPEDLTVRDAYSMQQFEREISVPDRTRVLTEHLASKIREWGPHQRTIVFCVSAAHADTVRTQLQNLLGVPEGLNRYAVRIVSEERDAAALLEEFQNRRNRQPLLATTVDLLSTGVDIPSLRNVVFMKPVSSPVVFKQILGRGTRLDPDSQKLFFRVVDYTNATRLLDAWDLPSPPDDENLIGTAVLSVHVVAADGAAVAGARVAVSFGRRTLGRGSTGPDGTCRLANLPLGELTLRVSAAGFSPFRGPVSLTEPSTETHLTMSTAERALGRVTISGVEVTLSSEVTLNLSPDGRQLTVSEYVDLAGRRIRETLDEGSATLVELWRDPDSRSRLRAALRERQVDPDLLALVLARTDVDGVDLLAHAAFTAPLRTRDERASRVEDRADTVMPELSVDEQSVLRALLDQYRVGGVDELDSAAVFRTPSLQAIGGLEATARLLGGAGEVRRILQIARLELYRNGGVA